ncbi:hypothetical protein QNH39_27750 [Neobacillus novalis]|uniref:Uncharacterized protein n=1 Tax=Neobacillus novalis TaxID=220687 RepID=A0AA95MMQ4_9BACI|nr:hypothetical protein [Neobacillus novalis]WHY86315.1 hypothetical protein QNH39_27750 [Neobacillus novalis]
MDDTTKIIEWIQSLPSKKQKEFKEAMLDLNEIQETDPDHFNQSVKKISEMVRH